MTEGIQGSYQPGATSPGSGTRIPMHRAQAHFSAEHFSASMCPAGGKGSITKVVFLLKQSHPSYPCSPVKHFVIPEIVPFINMPWG